MLNQKNDFIRLFKSNKMPEGPETRMFADALKIKLVGHRLLKLSVNRGSRYYAKGPLPGTQSLPLELTTDEYLYSYEGQFVDVDTKGKKIIITILSQSKQIYIGCSLGMGGCWLFDQPDAHSGVTLYI